VKLRVVISSTNKEQTKSLVDQLLSSKDRIEIIVILQASYLRNYKKDVKIINFNEKIGLSRSRNFGAFYKGIYDYCVFLDDDVSINKGFIKRIREVIFDFSPDMIAGLLVPRRGFNTVP